MRTMLKETKKLENSMIEMIFEVPAELFIAREAEALKILGSDIEIAGFRKGKVPTDVLKSQLPEIDILEKMAELVVGEIYPKTVMDEKIEVIGRPEVSITKLARGNALEFKVKTAVLPEVNLPDYKKIVKEEWKKENTEEISDEEVEKAIKDVRQMRAHQKLHDDKTEHDHHAVIKDEDLPVFDDEFVKTLGNFQNVAEFREKLRDNLKLEKKMEQKNKNRSAVIERIAKETKADLPEVIIKSELERMINELRITIERAGLSFDDYYKHIGKSEEDMRKEFEPEAKKRALIQLAIFEISKKEKLTPTEEEIKTEAEAIASRHKDVDPMRVSAYVEQVLTNEKVFNYLEKLAS